MIKDKLNKLTNNLIDFEWPRDNISCNKFIAISSQPLIFILLIIYWAE